MEDKIDQDYKAAHVLSLIQHPTSPSLFPPQAIQAYLAYKQLNDIQNEASGLAGYSDAGGIGGGYGGGFPPHTESAGAGGSYQSPYAS